MADEGQQQQQQQQQQALEQPLQLAHHQQHAPTSRARPESTIAKNFAADLDSMFGLSVDPAVDSLHRTVEEKKSTVNNGQATLQELEAKLRETEERLAKVSRTGSPQRPVGDTTGDDSSLVAKQATDGAVRPSPLAQKPTFPADRPPTAERPPTERQDTKAMMAGMPGSLPETPQQQYNGSSEYVMVDSNGERGYG